MAGTRPRIKRKRLDMEFVDSQTGEDVDVIATIPDTSDDGSDPGFKGYWGTDREGNTIHSFDFETAIGE